MSTQLHLDIQLLIIERLPIKSLLRFRSVCKAWNSFVSSFDFIAFHHDHSQQHGMIIRYKDLDDQLIKYVSLFDDDDDQSFALTVPPLVQGTRVLDTSHGLVCTLDSFFQTRMAVLWNPAIRRSIAVAVPNIVDPQQFYSIVAFGVCPATMDPKIVKITYIKNEEEMENISCIPFQVMVFTLSSCQWTTLPSTTNLPRKSIQFCNGYETVVIGQLIYLLCRASDFDGERRTLIMSFHLTTHEFREVDIPNSLCHSYSLRISRLRESLVLLHTDQDLIQDKEVVHVWMMDDGDSKAFTKIFTVNPPNADVWRTLGFRESGEPIVEWTHDEIDPTSKLGVYEPGLGDIKDLGIRGNNYSFYATSYTESLLLLDHDDDLIIRC